MKQASKIIIGVISAAVVAGIVLAIVEYPSTTNPTNASTETTKETSNQMGVKGHPPPTPLSVYGSPIDLAQAKAMVQYHIPTIGSPPAGVTLQRVTAGSICQCFKLMYAPSPIPPDATVEDFMFKLNGILFTGEAMPPTATEQEGLQPYLASDPSGRTQLMKINGLDAAVTERDATKGLGSTITIYHNHARYELASDMLLADLIKIAETVNWQP